MSYSSENHQFCPECQSSQILFDETLNTHICNDCRYIFDRSTLKEMNVRDPQTTFFLGWYVSWYVVVLFGLIIFIIISIVAALLSFAI